MHKNPDSPMKKSKVVKKKNHSLGKGNTVFMDPTGIKHRQSMTEKISKLNKNLYQEKYFPGCTKIPKSPSSKKDFSHTEESYNHMIDNLRYFDKCK